MTDFWAVIGLAICDEDFREELKTVRKNRKRLLDTVLKYGFRLGCYELVEFQRLISIKLTDFPPDPPPQDTLELMDYLHNSWWVPEDPCIWDFALAALSKKYQHPYLVFDNKAEKNVPGAVDPLTSEPISNEVFHQGTAREPVKRFVKARSPLKG